MSCGTKNNQQCRLNDFEETNACSGLVFNKSIRTKTGRDPGIDLITVCKVGVNMLSRPCGAPFLHSGLLLCKIFAPVMFKTSHYVMKI